MRIVEDYVHVKPISAGVVQSFHLVPFIDRWRSVVFAFAARRTTAKGTSIDQTTNLEQSGTGRRRTEQQSQLSEYILINIIMTKCVITLKSILTNILSMMKKNLVPKFNFKTRHESYCMPFSLLPLLDPRI